MDKRVENAKEHQGDSIAHQTNVNPADNRHTEVVVKVKSWNK